MAKTNSKDQRNVPTEKLVHVYAMLNGEELSALEDAYPDVHTTSSKVRQAILDAIKLNTVNT